jgi:hypothetical protein
MDVDGKSELTKLSSPGLYGRRILLGYMHTYFYLLLVSYNHCPTSKFVVEDCHNGYFNLYRLQRSFYLDYALY